MTKEASTPRITMQTIWAYIFSIFNLERGLGYTMWQLTIRPGDAIREFLFSEKRKKHIKPMSFLILSVSISTFLILKMLPEDIETINGELSNDQGYSSLFLKEFESFVFKYFNLIQMLKIPFLSIGTFYLFKKSKFNFAEHLVLNSYVFSYISFFLVLIVSLTKLFNTQIVMAFLVMSLVYPCFVYFKLFNESVFQTFVKYFGINLIASILHTVFIMGIASIWQQISFSI